MKKIAIIVAGVVLLISLVLFFVFREDSFEKKMDALNKDMTSYTLHGMMNITKGEDKKNYALEVGYKKNKNEDYFRVSITDKDLNQTQVILRNKEGVYVLTPTLNQIFKFEGDWPLNSLKPYLLQSMSEILESEACTIEKKDNGYFASSAVKYPNNSNFALQEMYFDENAKIQKLSIKDKENVEQLFISFSKVNYDAKLKDTYFALPENMEESVSAPVYLEEQLPLYPIQVENAQLTSTKSIEVATGVKYILEYSGEKGFTLVQSLQKQSAETETIIMSGELLDSIDGFGFYDGNHMQMIVNGIEYTIYSDVLSMEEMSAVLNSMQVVVMK